MAAKKKPAKKPARAQRKPAKTAVARRSARPARKPVKTVKATKAPARKAATKTKKPVPAKKAAAKKPAPAPRAVAKAAPKPVARVAPKAAAKPPVKPVAKPAAKPVAKMTGKIAAIRLTPAPPREFKRPPAADRDYMNPRQIEAFRKQLLDWKRSLMEEVDRTVHHMQDEASNFPDPNDRATQEEEFALELRARDRERKLIKKIDEALLSLDSGDYGYCEICGVEIGIKRLEARPTATLCIDCKNLEEIKERQYG